MNSKIKKYIKEAFIFVVILAIAMNVMSYYRSLDLNKDKLDDTSFNLFNNKSFTVPKDKPVLIHFWATWCPTCKFEAPNIEEISKKYDVVTIAVQSGSNEDIQNYLYENKLTFNVVNDKDGYYSRKFNINVFPTTFVYDKDKKLTFSEVGYTSTAGLNLRMLMSK